MDFKPSPPPWLNAIQRHCKQCGMQNATLMPVTIKDKETNKIQKFWSATCCGALTERRE